MVSLTQDSVVRQVEPTTQEYVLTPSRLEGVVRVSGAKNSVLKLLTASLLTERPVRLRNYPQTLLDAQIHVGMLQALGKSCVVSDDEIHIKENDGVKSDLMWDGRSIRNTLLILGALLTRTGSASVPLPGGCQLGERKYDLHELVLRSLGATVWEEGGRLHASAPDGLIGADIHLPIRSTGATENGIIAGTLAKGITRIWNPHIRPEVLDLVAFLRSMGAHIEVRGQEQIIVEGVEELNEVQHQVIPDNMEALTWMIGAVITKGEVEIQRFPVEHLEVPLAHLRESGVEYFQFGDRLIVRGGTPYPVEISTGPYPGINSDMQPLFALFGACANGESRIVDLRFHGRYGYAEEFRKLGVDSQVDGNMLRISGGAPLHGSRVRAVDLRAGAALSLAGLVASDQTVVEDAWQVERGYNQFHRKLAALGGSIEQR